MREREMSYKDIHRE